MIGLFQRRIGQTTNFLTSSALLAPAICLAMLLAPRAVLGQAAADQKQPPPPPTGPAPAATKDAGQAKDVAETKAKPAADKKNTPKKIPEIMLKEVQREFLEMTEEEEAIYQSSKKKKVPLTSAEREIVRKRIKLMAYAMSDPVEWPRLPDLREDITDEVRETEKSFREAYYEELVYSRDGVDGVLAELLDDNLRVRLNAMILIADVKFEPAAVLIARELKRPDQHEAVKYWGAIALQRLGAQGFRIFANQEKAIDALLTMLAQSDNFIDLTVMQAIQALGEIRSVDLRPGMNEVAKLLVSYVQNKNKSWWLRSTAAAALGKLVPARGGKYDFIKSAQVLANYLIEATEQLAEPERRVHPRHVMPAVEAVETMLRTLQARSGTSNRDYKKIRRLYSWLDAIRLNYEKVFTHHPDFTLGDALKWLPPIRSWVNRPRER